MNSIGERVKLIRKLNKLTQIEFAKKLDISQGTLSEIESGKAKPSYDVLVFLAEKYDIDLNWLVLNCTTENTLDLSNDELALLGNYRLLEDDAKAEMLDYTELKLIRYKKK
ncbi:helix-turn-helix domain-containing protein [Brevibacillus sp. NRS-1366]|uniref:helix-turn-helix domain-containing protein n=1 Tax=Brevibacillus sp. NRS-1366 TaxID=3233899 RepID=UPI003D1C82B5